MLKKSLLALALLAGGCAHVKPPAASTLPPPATDTLIWSTMLGGHEREWADEFEKHLHVRPILVFCHGDVDPDGIWWMYPDRPLHRMRVRDVAQMLHYLYPGRYIALICCDTGQVKLDTPGVFYCRSFESVWDRPGQNLNLNKFTHEFEFGGGFFKDFEEGGK